MTARKKNLRSVTRNRYGNPIIKVRADIGAFTWDGATYNELQLVAHINGITCAIKDTATKNYNERAFDLEVYVPLNCYSTYELECAVNDVVAFFKKGLFPFSMVAHHVHKTRVSGVEV